MTEYRVDIEDERGVVLKTCMVHAASNELAAQAVRVIVDKMKLPASARTAVHVVGQIRTAPDAKFTFGPGR